MGYFPLFKWIQTYTTNDFRGDLVGGITVAIMLVPQGMAYAMIAGLPPVYGLYAALFPQIVYAFMGSSRQLAVGPVAMDSLLVASGLNALSITDPDQYISLAIFLAFFMGCIQLLLAALKLGFLVNFLSKPVINGFTSAAAIIIGLSQFNHLLGINLVQSNQILALLVSLKQTIAQTNFLALAIGGCSTFLLISLKKRLPKFPTALLLVVMGSLLASTFQWNELGLHIVGYVPEGLPQLKLPSASIKDVYALSPLAITLALIAFMEAISVAKAIEENEKTSHLNSNQELLALGTANLVGSFFQAYPTTGGFSRTAVNHQAGTKTGIAALISAFIVGLTLLFFTPFFFYLPKSILAAIILTAVVKLVDIKYPQELWKVNKQEFYVLIATFSITLFIGLKEGILLGVFIALILLVYRLTMPHIAVLGQIKNTPYFKNINRFPDEITPSPGILMVRFDGPLFFGNQAYFKSELNQLILQAESPVKHLIIHAGPIHYIDATALNLLKNWQEELQQANISLSWVRAIGPIRDFFYQNGILKLNEKPQFFNSLEAAINYLVNNKISPEEISQSTQINH